MFTFVELTKQSDGTPTYVNPHHVIEITSISGGTQLTTTGTNSNGAAKTIVVRENLDAVMQGFTALGN